MNKKSPYRNNGSIIWHFNNNCRLQMTTGTFPMGMRMFRRECRSKGKVQKVKSVMKM